MLTYYYDESHHAHAKIHIILLEKEIEYQSPPIPGGSLESEEFLKLSPLGRLPLLVDENITLTDVFVISEYLEEKFPTSPLMPTDIEKRAQCRFLSAFHDYTLSPLLTFLHSAISKGKANEPRVQQEALRLKKGVISIEKIITPSPFLLGDMFYLCDASYVMFYHYLLTILEACQHPLQLEEIPKLNQWFETVSKRLTVKKVLDQYIADPT